MYQYNLFFYFFSYLFQAALHVEKYQIVLRHLRHIKDNSLVSNYRNKDEQNLLHILAMETKSGANKHLLIKVWKMYMNVYFCLDIICEVQVVCVCCITHNS